MSGSGTVGMKRCDRCRSFYPDNKRHFCTGKELITTMNKLSDHEHEVWLTAYKAVAFNEAEINVSLVAQRAGAPSTTERAETAAKAALDAYRKACQS